MGNQEFLEICRAEVVRYYKNMGLSIDFDETFIVWSCKILQNNKCLASTSISDRRYFEFTYNGDQHELYLDCYVKEDNQCIYLHNW